MPQRAWQGHWRARLPGPGAAVVAARLVAALPRGWQTLAEEATARTTTRWQGAQAGGALWAAWQRQAVVHPMGEHRADGGAGSIGSGQARRLARLEQQGQRGQQAAKAGVRQKS